MSFGHTPSGNLTPSAYGWQGDTGKGDDGLPHNTSGLYTLYWDALVAFLQSLGLALTLDNYHQFFTDTYRSYAAQVAAHNAKPSITATPGKSIHGLRMAVDWNNDRSDWSRIYAALKAHGAHYGIVPLPSESWHWQYSPIVFLKGVPVALSGKEKVLVAVGHEEYIGEIDGPGSMIHKRGLAHDAAVVVWPKGMTADEKKAAAVRATSIAAAYIQHPEKRAAIEAATKG
jgi:hypothetical protein